MHDEIRPSLIDTSDPYWCGEPVSLTSESTLSMMTNLLETDVVVRRRRRRRRCFGRTTQVTAPVSFEISYTLLPMHVLTMHHKIWTAPSIMHSLMWMHVLTMHHKIWTAPSIIHSLMVSPAALNAPYLEFNCTLPISLNRKKFDINKENKMRTTTTWLPKFIRRARHLVQVRRLQ